MENTSNAGSTESVVGYVSETPKSYTESSGAGMPTGTSGNPKAAAASGTAWERKQFLNPAVGVMIPKHRFDCVNLCLKETKQALREKSAEAERQKARIAELEKALLESKAETVLAVHRAKSLTAAKALIDFSNLKPERDGSVPGLEEEVLRVKESRGYLFEDRENVTYLLVPVRSGNAQDKSIADYVNGQKQNAPTGAAEERE